MTASLHVAQADAGKFLCKVYEGKQVKDGFVFLGEYMGWGTALVHVKGNTNGEMMCYMASPALVRKRFAEIK